MSTKGLTQSQRYAFFKAMSAACSNLGIVTSEEREAYRKKVMMEETRKSHLSMLGRTTDFDRCMARFSADAGYWQTASKFASADGFRIGVMIRICCQQIMQLKGLPDGSDAARNYIVSILKRSRIACGTCAGSEAFWMDVSEDTALSVFKMLDTHRRRLLSAFSEECVKGFDSSAVYTVEGDRLRITFDRRHYASYDGLKVCVTDSLHCPLNRR